MCLSIPGKITKIKDGTYSIKYETQRATVQNSLVDNLQVGDWVIVQNKFIIQQLSKSQAQEFFEIIK